MRFRNWLLTGTSIGLLAFAPLTVSAQDSGLVAAYQAYVSAKDSGDAGALETAQAAFTEQCIVAGYASIDDCIAKLNAPAEAPPAEEPAPAPTEEATPPAAEEPAPAPEAAEPAPQEKAAPAEEPAPEAEPAPAQEEAAPAAKAAPAEEPAPTEEAAPAAEQPEPAAEPAPATETAPATEAAPTTEAAPADAAPATEEAAPAAQPDAAPSAKVAPTGDISADLSAQVDAYNGAIADILSGGDRTTADANIAAARAQIEALCQQAGQSDVDACLAKYGLSLTPVPGADTAPATGAETPATGTEAPATGTEAPTTPAADATTPVDQNGQPTEVIDALPKGVTQDQVAPVLDSAKDSETIAADPNAQAAQPAAIAADAPPPAPPPADDKASQANIEVVPAADMSATVDQGTQIAAPAALAAPEALPPNVTIVNQTNVVNNVTNNTTNNTVNNTTNNTTNNTAVVNNGQIQQTQVVLQIGTQLVVQNRGQDTDRFVDRNAGDEVYYEDVGRGRTRETITRPDGSKLVTVRNANGDVLRRSRIDAGGQEHILAYVDDRYDEDILQWRDPGEDLPPLRLNIPVNQYVIDARDNDEEQVATFFRQPPVEQVQRLYSIDEVKRSARIRDTVRRLEVGGLTFDSGAATISRDQVGALSNVATAMLQLLKSNPAETFLIEGHTDAVGTDIKNLQLSDLRAATVARILTDFYKIPPENLATQGYGERYLKIRTELAERENRRVTIRRITPLVAPLASN